MKQQLSPTQVAFILANFIFSGTIITMQQILIEIAKQNTWIVILLIYPFILGLVLLISHKVERLEKVKELFETENKSWFKRIFILILLLYLLFIFIRDFRSVNGFVDVVLLPDTPIDIIAILIILTITYISLTGIEVIGRVTVIHFFTVFIVLLALPFMLLNEIELANIQPIGGMNSVQEILKSIFLFFPWMAEITIVIFLLIFLNPLTKLKKASIYGISLGFIPLFILVSLNIMVLGVAVASETTYPNMALTQQINLTDFLDRLDLIIVVVWIPTMLCKLALLLFSIEKLVNVLREKDSDLGLIPLALLLSLSTHLFRSNIDSIEYSFFTWATQGLLFEVVIVGLFLILKHRKKGIERI